MSIGFRIARPSLVFLVLIGSFLASEKALSADDDTWAAELTRSLAQFLFTSGDDDDDDDSFLKHLLHSPQRLAVP